MDIAVQDDSEVRKRVRSTWQAIKHRGWEFALLLAKIRTEKLWKNWEDEGGKYFRSFSQWGDQELGIRKKSTLLRYAKMGEMIAKLSDDEIRRWMQHPFFVAYEVMPIARRDPQSALELLEKGYTQSRLREVVGAVQGEDRPCMIRLHVSRSTYEAWCGALNALRVVVGSGGVRYPTDEDLISAIVGMIEVAPEVRTMWVDGHRKEIDGDLWEDMKAGKVRCQHCDGYAHLQRHHIIPRSHGGVDDEGTERLMWLCAQCHRMVTENVDGTWRGEL